MSSEWNGPDRSEPRPNTWSGPDRRLRSKTITHAGGIASGAPTGSTPPPASDRAARFPNDPALAWVRNNMFGTGVSVPSPYGVQQRRYFDYTASGLPFRPIEDLVQKHVLPYMSNTHSSSSYASDLIGSHVDAAHEKVRAAVRGTKDDAVIFTGAGATAAVNKLISSLGLRIPEAIQRRIDWQTQIPPELRPIVILSRMEHHSNDLPWRESIADIEYVGYDSEGRANWRDIERLLSSPEYRDRPLKLGSFTAGSNVTGVLNDTKQLAAAMHANGGLAFFDFAAAAPHIAIDLHPEDNPAYAKDAIFLSVHKFTGGPQSPGLLIANRRIFDGAPAEPGGGTVLYTSPWEYRYVDDAQQREASGTPSIVSVIRAGLAFDLKMQVGERVERLEQHCLETATRAWRNHPKIHILGPDPLTVPRLAIMSLVLDGGALHHNLAVRLLNDLYGIQVRGGCMCAGTYGHDLLGIDKRTSEAIRCELDNGNLAAKPGWVRVSFGPAVAFEDLDILIKGVRHVAEHWREYVDQYVFDPDHVEWRHRDDTPATSDLALRIPPAIDRLIS